MPALIRSLWPETVRRPYLRLLFSLLAAPVVLAMILTLLAFLAAGSSETSRAGTMAATYHAALAFFLALPAFTLSFGIAGVALLWGLGRRGVPAWLGTGAAVGVIAAAAHTLATGADVMPVRLLAAAVLGLTLFAMIRWFAGVRRG